MGIIAFIFWAWVAIAITVVFPRTVGRLVLFFGIAALIAINSQQPWDPVSAFAWAAGGVFALTYIVPKMLGTLGFIVKERRSDRARLNSLRLRRR